MKIRTRTSIAAVAVASVIGGGVVGAVLTGPTAAIAQEAEEESTVRPDRGSTIESVLADLVEDGVITQEQADAVAEALEDARPQRGFRGFHGLGAVAEEIAATLDLTVDDLTEALRDGSSLADLAAQQGVEVDIVIGLLVEQAQERLDAAVEDGRLTADEAAERLGDIESKITEMVNGELEPGRRGFGRGHRGPHGQGDDAAPDASDTVFNA